MDLHQTDPEFAERFAYFAFQEVINEENQQLDEKTRYMAISAALIGCGAVDAYREMLPRALENGMAESCPFCGSQMKRLPRGA